MRKYLMVALLTSSLATLDACVITASRPESKGVTVAGKPYVDVEYLQFAMSGDSANKTPVDLSALPDVAEQCHGARGRPKAGGVNIISSVAGAAVGALANLIVSGMQSLVKKAAAEYSAEEAGQENRAGFYTTGLWFTNPDAEAPGDQYSCFVITVTQCDESKIDKATHSCPADTRKADTRAVIVGQYRLTSEYLQVRPLAGQIRGFAAKRNDDKDASLAATLAFQSTWWDGHEGHSDTDTVKVLSVKFKPTDEATGYNLKVQEEDAKSSTGYSFAKWKSLPLLKRPPQSPGSNGTIGVTPTVAEATAPPEYLQELQNLLKAHSSDLSSALKNALNELVPQKK